MGTLTGKKALFVDAYLGPAERDPTRAAELAGFSNPDKQGTLLLRSAEVLSAIEARLAEAPALAPPVVRGGPEQDAAQSEPATTAAQEGGPAKATREQPKRLRLDELAPEVNEAADLLTLRAIHLTTEHYRAHRPAVLQDGPFTPGATFRAMVRRAPLHPDLAYAAWRRLRRAGLAVVIGYTTPIEGHPDERPICHPSEAGLALLGSIAPARWPALETLVWQAGYHNPRRRAQRSRHDPVGPAPATREPGE
ncbi:MAG: hypothetical protein K8H88_08115 [Sandaracinaceae bacterium]|nr:hypothetical protein [Sandaracinaceae bacterium]